MKHYLVLLLILCSLVKETGASTPVSLAAAGTLYDVCVAPKHPGKVWAVGDHGVIWHTEDGGNHWEIQPTPIDCTLRSISFLDESFGIAVGGYFFPFTSQSRGVVLVTQDGGKHWALRPDVRQPNLHPNLYKVKIFDPMKALIAGETNENFPSGLLVTDDGGQTWKPGSGGQSEGWKTSDFYDTKTGFGVGLQGTLQRFQSEITPSQTAAFGLNLMTAVKTATGSEMTGWGVGDGGLVLSTADQGLRWGVVPGSLPGISSTTIDLKTIESRDQQLWVAGNPGTFIYSSPNGGKNWTASPTHVVSAIRKIVFFDDHYGWAVGDLGTILKTDDGGKSWRTQQIGGGRLAVLGIFGCADDIPFEAFASLCGNQGYLGGTVLLFRDESRKKIAGSSAWLDRVHDAVVRTGANTVWELGGFPLLREELFTTQEKVIEHIQQATDGKGMSQLRERLVAAIRQTAPEIVLIPNSAAVQKGLPMDRNSAVKEIVLREAMSAIKQAGDPSAFPYQIKELGLPVWNVNKVFLVLDDGTLGEINLPTTDASPELGLPLDELAFASRGMIESEWSPKPAILGFSEALQGDGAAPNGRRDFFAGIDVPMGSDARRILTRPLANRWEEIQQRAMQRRHIFGILQNTAKIAEAKGRPVSDVGLVSHAAELTRKIDQDAAVEMLLELGQKYRVSGDFDSAYSAYEILVKQYPQHPLARQAFFRMLQYDVSGEIGWRKDQQNTSTSTETTFAAFVPDGKNRRQPVMQKTELQNTMPNERQTAMRLDRVLAFERYLEQRFPDIANDVQVRFAASSAQRRRGWDQDAAGYYRSRANLKFDDIWSMRARAEYWLTVRDKMELPIEQRELPIPSLVCSFTQSKPFLDGKFDNEADQGIWFKGQLYTLTPIKQRSRLEELLGENKNRLGVEREKKLREESKIFGTQTMFLYDKEFLYIGIRCPKVAGFEYPSVVNKQRGRDVPIADQDRIEILLDLDRDYITFDSLTIDSRGWVNDSCLGDKSWNPTWHIARHEDNSAWYIELAIPFSSLSDRKPETESVWGIALRRIVPGYGIECWNAENSENLREGFGFLVFH
jgi:photosystem II stability/assembly factor-like uncharacterized protein